MRLSEYAEFDATAIAELIRCGEVTAAEVHWAAVEGIETVNRHLNAVVGPLFDTPLAHAAEGPLGGVPFALKDLLVGARGLPRQSGSRLTQGHVATSDTELMGRFRAAGLAVVGRTSTPEFGLSFTTEPVAGGPTRNPWNLGLTAGGSSGGAAALVASGALPCAHANDALGSIRVPASYCGLVGLKPTRGLIPPGPDEDEPLFGLTSEFVITRSVRDSATVLDAIAGSAPGDRYQVARPPLRYASALHLRRRLRIAVQATSVFGATVDSDVAALLDNAAETFARMGHYVTYAAPTIDGDQLAETLLRFVSASAAATVVDIAGPDAVEEATGSLERSTAALVALGLALNWPALAQARSWQNSLTRASARFHQTFDILLTPTTATSAPAIGSLEGNRPGLTAESWISDLLQQCPFTPLHNVTGQPAISIPGGFVGGLPVGIQLAAPHGGEGTLLALATEFEQAAALPSPRPRVHLDTASAADMPEASAAANSQLGQPHSAPSPSDRSHHRDEQEPPA